MRQACWYWLPVCAYAALIFYVSSLSYPEVYVPSVLMELGDKALHAIEYAVLGILCYRAFRRAAAAYQAPPPPMPHQANPAVDGDDPDNA